MGFATAASLGATLATVGLSLFRYLQLPLPSSSSSDRLSRPAVESKPRSIWVYGRGTATGAMAIQVLRLASFATLTTCSPSSATRAKQLGAVATFDYRSPTCGTDIREHSADSLALALDCITDTTSMNIYYQALGSAGGRYVALDAFPLRGHTRRSVKPDWVCTPTQFGKAIAWAPPYNLEPRPLDHECAKAWYVIAQRLLDEGCIEAHPMEEREGGLPAVPAGMEAVRREEIKGKKLVYPIARDLCHGLARPSR